MFGLYRLLRQIKIWERRTKKLDKYKEANKKNKETLRGNKKRCNLNFWYRRIFRIIKRVLNKKNGTICLKINGSRL